MGELRDSTLLKLMSQAQDTLTEEYSYYEVCHNLLPREPLCWVVHAQISRGKSFEISNARIRALSSGEGEQLERLKRMDLKDDVLEPPELTMLSQLGDHWTETSRYPNPLCESCSRFQLSFRTA